MADIFLASCLLLGGFFWSALIVLAMMRHPTGGTDFAVYPFLAGLIAMAIGTVWWVAIVISWLI